MRRRRKWTAEETDLQVSPGLSENESSNSKREYGESVDTVGFGMVFTRKGSVK